MKEAKQPTGALIAALLLISSSPLGAQVVIGGDRPESAVTVDWSVLDKLGPAPSLPDMLKKNPPANGVERRIQHIANAAESNVIFRPLTSEGTVPANSSAAAKSKPSAPKAESTRAPTTRKSPSASDVQIDRLEDTTAQNQKNPVAPAQAPTAQVAPPPAPVGKNKEQPKESPVTAKPPAPAAALLISPPPVAAPAPVPAAQKPATPTPAAIQSPAPVPAAPTPAAPVVAAAPTPAAPTPVPPAPAAQSPTTTGQPVVQPPEQPQRIAALSSSVPAPAAPQASDGIIHHGDILTILFRPDDNQLPNGAPPALTQLAQRMSRDDTLTLQLLAYADGDSTNISKARRLSLSRALEVRKVLMDLGVRSTRIEVRALGNKAEGTAPLDRVDALVTSH